MGAALDWIVELTKTNGWKSMRMCYGPTINQFLAVHPDTARIVLQKGDKTIRNTHSGKSSSYNILIDPKSDMNYYPFTPWLGKFNPYLC